MEEFNNDIFKFDAEDDSSSTFFQQNNFQDDNIENLSEDMYENENLFNLEVEQNNQPSVSSDFLTQEQNIFSNFNLFSSLQIGELEYMYSYSLFICILPEYSIVQTLSQVELLVHLALLKLSLVFLLTIPNSTK